VRLAPHPRSRSVPRRCCGTDQEQLVHVPVVGESVAGNSVSIPVVTSQPRSVSAPRQHYGNLEHAVRAAPFGEPGADSTTPSLASVSVPNSLLRHRSLPPPCATASAHLPARHGSTGDGLATGMNASNTISQTVTAAQPNSIMQAQIAHTNPVGMRTTPLSGPALQLPVKLLSTALAAPHTRGCHSPSHPLPHVASLGRVLEQARPFRQMSQTQPTPPRATPGCEAALSQPAIVPVHRLGAGSVDLDSPTPRPTPSPGEMMGSSGDYVLQVRVAMDSWERLAFRPDSDFEQLSVQFVRQLGLKACFQLQLCAKMRQMLVQSRRAASVDIVDLI